MYSCVTMTDAPFPGTALRKYTVRLGLYLILIIGLVIFLLPIFVMINTSFKDPATINLATTWELPKSLYWQSYAEAIHEFGPRIWNSITLVTNSTLLSAVIGSLNGYVLSKWRIPGERVIFLLILLGLFIPYQGILIPLFEFMRDIHLYGGISGLVIIHTIYGLPITTLIFRNFYAEIPNEMLEAAAIDGAGFFDIYAQIIFPLSTSAFVVVIIWQFTQIWNEFLFAVTMTTGQSEPLTVGLAQLAGGEAVKWNLPMAGAVVTALPPIIVYVIMSRYFVRGLLAGSGRI
jgi:glucose/mannose transport system permease protein